MYSESSLESTVQRCGTCGPSHGHERHRCQPAKGTACRVRTIVDVPALGDLNVLRSKYSATASVLVLHPPPAPTVNVNLPTMASVPSSPTSPLSPLPTQTYHTSILPRSIPTAALLDSAVGGAHYSGVESVNERRRSVRGHTRISHEGGVSLSRRRSSGMPSEPNPFHLTVLDDIKDVRDSFSPRPGDAIRIYPWFFSNGGYRCTKVLRRRRCCRSDGGRMRSTRCACFVGSRNPHLDCLLDGCNLCRTLTRGVKA